MGRVGGDQAQAAQQEGEHGGERQRVKNRDSSLLASIRF